MGLGLILTYIIPTLHPAHILRGAPLTDVIAADLRKAFRVAEFGYYQPENIVVAHPASPVGMEESVRCALQWIRRWRSMRCPVAVDVETSSVDFMACRLYSIALSGEDGCNTAVAFTLEDLITLPWDATAALVYELRRLLADATIPKVFHNAPFDMAVLIQHGYRILGSILDTQGYAHCVQPDVRKTLGWIGHQWLDVEPWKRDHEGRKQALTSDIIELLVYNGKDALNTMKVRSLLEQEVLDRGMSYKLMQYQMAFSQLAARMEIYGIPINKNIRRARSLEFQRRIQDYLQTMRQWLNWDDFNPNRNVHVIEALFSRPRNGRNYLGLSPTQYTPSTRAPSVSYKAIIDHIQHPFVRAFMNYVETRDAWATRYRTADEGKPSMFTKNIYADGRLHPKWNPTGQKGSRFSSSPNCQNVPEKERDMFEAPPGRVMVQSDKDQLELRIIACRAGVMELVEEMAKPDADPHRLAAMNVYGEEFHRRSAKDQKNLRNMVKNVVYASLYNAGPQTVHRTIRVKKELDPAVRAAMTLKVVKHIHRSYFGKYVEIPAYHQRNYELAMAVGYNECEPLGRRRYFPVRPPPFTEVGNWSTQTEGSDHAGVEMVHIQEDLDALTKGDAQIILHGHDAVCIECSERHAERVKAIVDYHFGATRIEGPAGVVYLTSKADIGKNLRKYA